MTGRMRYAPCPHPGCPELAASCPHHRRVPWAGRNGNTRREAMGVSTATWEKLRRACIRRDGSACRRCGAAAVQVDHLVPLAWRKPPIAFGAHLRGLLCLCSTCHAAKTQEEASIGRLFGSPPPVHRIESHVQRWGAIHAAL